MAQHTNNYPKLHNAAWPGLVGKGPDSEPPIDLDTMIDLTANASGRRREVRRHGPVPVRPARLDRHRRRRHQAARRQVPLEEPRDRLRRRPRLAAHRRRQRDGRRPRSRRSSSSRSARPAASPSSSATRASARTASSASTRPPRPGDWAKDPEGNQKKIAQTFRQACDVAESLGEKLAAEGEICWGGMHSWRRMVQLLELVDRPQTLGFQADMAHTLLYTMGYNAPEDALLPPNYDWQDKSKLEDALEEAHRRPAPVDDRLPRRPEQRHRLRLRLPRQDRPALPRHRPHRQARHPQARRLLAPRRERQPHEEVQAHVLGRLHVLQRDDDEAADVERHPRA